MSGRRKKWLHFMGGWLWLLVFIGLLLLPVPKFSRADIPPTGAQPQLVYLPVIQRDTLNRLPVAAVSASLTSGTAPLHVRFHSNGSHDVDGSLTRFDWDFGDGSSGQNASEQHEFSRSGLYPVMLTVTDDQGGTALATIIVRVNAPAMMTKNVILFIGDGMGFEHVKAGGMYLNGSAGTLPFERFPHQAQMVTNSDGGNLTDSAAAATAMATGVKVQNGVLSMAIPGDGREFYTLLEYARDRGMSTGLVTTTTMTHATPASFGSHSSARTNGEEIAADYLNQTRPNLLFGGGGEGMTPEGARMAGYQVLTDRAALLGLNTESLAPDSALLSGQFGSGHIPYEADGPADGPHLSEMTSTALNLLDNDPDGFFLMVEGGRIDHASHSNLTRQMVGEVAEFARSVQTALDWAKANPNTLILVVADHETGGLTVQSGNGQGMDPSVTWSTTSHTSVNVPVYVNGAFQGILNPVIDNTQIPALISAGKFPGEGP